MSGLSLYGDFFKAASLAQSGAVRLAPGSDDKLVNTGTLGGRTVSVARNHPDKAGSRQKTIDAFKGALAERFGDDAAAAALKDLGLDKQGARLTGRLVFDAAKGASAHANAARGAVMAANVAANEAALQRFLPPDPPAPVSTVVPPPPRGAPPPLPPRPGPVIQQQAVAGPVAAVPTPTVAPPDAGAAPDLSKLRAALTQLGPSEATEYTQRLREAVRDAGASGWRRLDDQELEQLAWHALGEVGGDVRSANLAANQAALQRFLPPLPPGSDPALDATMPAASPPAADPPAGPVSARAKTAPDPTGDAASKPPVTAAAKDATLVSFLAAMKAAVAAEERAAPLPPADPPPPRDAPAPPMSAKYDIASRFAAAFDNYVATKGAAPDAASGGPQAVPLRDSSPVPVNAPPPPDEPPPPDSAATAKKHNDAELSRASEQVDDARLAAKVLV